MQNKLFLKAADICELLEVKQTSAYIWPASFCNTSRQSCSARKFHSNLCAAGFF